MNGNHKKEQTMNGRMIELAIRHSEKEGEYIGAAIINGLRIAEHILVSNAAGDLIAKGGNPARSLKIEDPLWYARLMPGVGSETEIIVTATMQGK